jgi:hypothetical protein
MPEPVIRIEPAWDDAGAVRRLIESRGPFPTLAEFEAYGDVGTLSWFRERWAVDSVAFFPEAQPILHNPNFVEAARRVSRAAVIRPQIVILNLMGPQPAGAPHVDTPSFRGLPRGKTPTPLLVLMGASGLFRRWSVPIASAIAWWYDGPAGDFEYWPQGPQGPVARETAPFGNVALVGDNDTMFHRVGAIGDPAHYLPPGSFTHAAELHYRPDGSADAIEAGALRWHYPRGQLRISLLWKAHAFADERAAALHDDHSDDLTPERVALVFAEDLARRGIRAAKPSHPFGDAGWMRLLAETYPIPGPRHS